MKQLESLKVFDVKVSFVTFISTKFKKKYKTMNVSSESLRFSNCLNVFTCTNVEFQLEILMCVLDYVNNLHIR